MQHRSIELIEPATTNTNSRSVAHPPSSSQFNSSAGFPSSPQATLVPIEQETWRDEVPCPQSVEQALHPPTSHVAADHTKPSTTENTVEERSDREPIRPFGTVIPVSCKTRTRASVNAVPLSMDVTLTRNTLAFAVGSCTSKVMVPLQRKNRQTKSLVTSSGALSEPASTRSLNSKLWVTCSVRN